MAMAEKQQEHRIATEHFGIKESAKLSHKGQIFGFALGITGLLVALICSLFGHEAIGTVLAKYTIVTLASVFALGKVFSFFERD